jgi:hypothetical protein
MTKIQGQIEVITGLTGRPIFGCVYQVMLTKAGRKNGLVMDSNTDLPTRRANKTACFESWQQRAHIRDDATKETPEPATPKATKWPLKRSDMREQNL